MDLTTNSNFCLTKIAHTGGDKLKIGDISLPLQQANKYYFESFKTTIETL